MVGYYKGGDWGLGGVNLINGGLIPFVINTWIFFNWNISVRGLITQTTGPDMRGFQKAAFPRSYTKNIFFWVRMLQVFVFFVPK